MRRLACKRESKKRVSIAHRNIEKLIAKFTMLRKWLGILCLAGKYDLQEYRNSAFVSHAFNYISHHHMIIKKKYDPF